MAQVYLATYANYPKDEIMTYLEKTSDAFIENIVYILEEFTFET